MKTALIATCRREAAAIDAFLDAVLSQSRASDAIVIADAGSDDGTIERLRARAETEPTLTLLVLPGANRSVGRNAAVDATDAEVIAVTDVGALPSPDWFKRIITPLETDHSVDVVAGYYRPRPTGLWPTAVAAALVPTADEVDPRSFLPSGRSTAFRRDAWAKVGGYPEHATRNEDTLFAKALRDAGCRVVFEPEAWVEWQPEVAPARLFRQFFRYAWGDAEAGLWFPHYLKAYLLALCTVALASWYGYRGAFPTYLAGLGLAYWEHYRDRALSRIPDPNAALLAPVANAVVDLAHVAGYTRGWLGRQMGMRRG